LVVKIESGEIINPDILKESQISFQANKLLEAKKTIISNSNTNEYKIISNNEWMDYLKPIINDLDVMYGENNLNDLLNGNYKNLQNKGGADLIITFYKKILDTGQTTAGEIMRYMAEPNSLAGDPLIYKSIQTEIKTDAKYASDIKTILDEESTNGQMSDAFRMESLMSLNGINETKVFLKESKLLNDRKYNLKIKYKKDLEEELHTQIAEKEKGFWDGYNNARIKTEELTKAIYNNTNDKLNVMQEIVNLFEDNLGHVTKNDNGAFIFERADQNEKYKNALLKYLELSDTGIKLQKEMALKEK